MKEMITLHMSNEIDYYRLNVNFPMIRRNMEWITSKCVYDEYESPVNKNWCELLKPMWDGDHKLYELKKRTIDAAQSNIITNYIGL